MSFSIDLWNGFDFVYTHFNERSKGLKQLLYMFNEKYDQECELARGIKRIYDFNFLISNEGTLSTAIAGFKSDLHKEYSCQFEYAAYVVYGGLWMA